MNRLWNRIAGAVLVATAAYTLFWYSTMPETIATHYDALGRPTDFGDKWMVLVLLGVASTLYGLLTLSMRYPKLWNVPVRVTDENREQIYKLTLGMMSRLNLTIMLMFCYMLIRTVQGGDLGIWFMIAVLIAVFGNLIHYFILVRRPVR